MLDSFAKIVKNIAMDKSNIEIPKKEFEKMDLNTQEELIKYKKKIKGKFKEYEKVKIKKGVYYVLRSGFIILETKDSTIAINASGIDGVVRYSGGFCGMSY